MPSHTNKPRWYYFDANILILLDKYGLIDNLEKYKRRTRSRLRISTTIEDELSGKNTKKPSKRHNMPASITSTISGGTIEVSSSVMFDKYKRGQLRARLLTIHDGEASLIELIKIDQSNNSAMQPLLVTNDRGALKAAKDVGVRTQSIANYLACMAACQLVKCEDAIQITVESLTREVYHQLTM